MNSKRRFAFTPIELLVVIATIEIFAAILFPVTDYHPCPEDGNGCVPAKKNSSVVRDCSMVYSEPMFGKNSSEQVPLDAQRTDEGEQE